jgi:hypothetical protein
MLDWLKQLFVSQPKPEPAPAPPSQRGVESKSIEASLRERPVPLAMPAVHLRAGAPGGLSRLGGLPSLPPHFSWPAHKGKPLAFLAQIALSEVHAALPSFLPASGFLFFFYDQDQSGWGLEAEDVGAWRVLYFEGDARECLPREAPEGLLRCCIYREKFVTPHLVDLLQHGDSQNGHSRHQMLGVSISATDPLDRNRDSDYDAETTRQYPSEDGMETGDADWSLLLELDSDDETGWAWGDVGTLYFWVGKEDARQKDFSQVWMTLESS